MQDRPRQERGGAGRSGSDYRGGTGSDRGRAERGGSERGGYERRGGERSDRERRDQRDSSERRPPRAPDPIDEIRDVDVSILPREVLRELESLSPATRERVEIFLAAARIALEEDSDQAYEYAKQAGRIGGRSAVVREAVGVAAYQAGDFANARKELMAARRISGRRDLLPMIADCERGLGNPRKALELANSEDGKELRGEAQAEMLLVSSGARRDLGELDTAIEQLAHASKTIRPVHSYAPRIYYAYADALLAAEREDQAREWFLRCASVDPEGMTDAIERIEEIDAQ